VPGHVALRKPSTVISQRTPSAPSPALCVVVLRVTVLCIIVLCVSARASVTRAQSCAGAERWAAACGSAQDVDVDVLFCPAGGLVLSARVGAGEPVRVEITRGRRDAFRRVGELGISPIAEYPDWNAAPESVRAGFDRVVACVRADPSLIVAGGTFVPTSVSDVGDAGPSHGASSWLVALGVLTALFVLGRDALRRTVATQRVAARSRLRSVQRRRRALSTAAALALLTVASYLARQLLVPFAFAHQNGQGPLWIDYALGAPSTYGPGYAELFGVVARGSADPDGVVFVAQALLAALGPLLLWLLARRVGARAPLAWALALALAIEPGIARLSGSESYFAAIGSLLLLAAAALATGARRARVRSVDFALGVIAAGLLAALAVRIHPIAAAPCACLPLVALVGLGSLRARLRVTVAATAAIGALALGGLLAALGGLTRGELGTTWLPGITSRIEQGRIGSALVVSVVLAALFLVRARRWQRAAWRALALGVALVVSAATYVLGDVLPIIEFGYLSLFIAPIAAATAAGLSGIALPRALAIARLVPEVALPAVVASLALIGAIVRAPALVALPTDARELAHLRAWREDLPPDATVVFVGVSGRRRLFVPMHGAFAAGTPYARQLDVAHPAPNLTALDARHVYYYRSSLCAVADTRGYCDDLERTYRMSPIRTAHLPARESMAEFGYADRSVDVTLSRVRR